MTDIDTAELERACVEVDPRGIRLRNAVVDGVLDLAGIEIPFPLRFAACEFTDAPVLLGAQMTDLALVDCPRLPGLLASGVRVRRDLDLSRSHVTGRHIIEFRPSAAPGCALPPPPPRSRGLVRRPVRLPPPH